ncbi:endoribonuclease MazF [Neorhizobium sp. JUb45]|uniref:endoribonuclease MazF n=1 Tax=unclassified Neorhizobium TaxID=2629175 RepID=UPI0010518CFD|nr:endoribonuclease MazF [Neorhizobium sp. JUb45]TCR06410.1 mRNA interferase MazF [Neorhizobium sp. JUb45]
MAAAGYVPDAGDIVWLNFSPQMGHEQAGRRPALVLSPASYNRHGLMLCCPMTTRRKGYPFEVVLGEDSIALADQVKSLDWKSRDAQRKGQASDAALKQVGRRR